MLRNDYPVYSTTRSVRESRGDNAVIMDNAHRDLLYYPSSRQFYYNNGARAYNGGRGRYRVQRCAQNFTGCAFIPFLSPLPSLCLSPLDMLDVLAGALAKSANFVQMGRSIW